MKTESGSFSQYSVPYVGYFSLSTPPLFRSALLNSRVWVWLTDLLRRYIFSVDFDWAARVFGVAGGRGARGAAVSETPTEPESSKIHCRPSHSMACHENLSLPRKKLFSGTVIVLNKAINSAEKMYPGAVLSRFSPRGPALYASTRTTVDQKARWCCFFSDMISSLGQLQLLV